MTTKKRSKKFIDYYSFLNIDKDADLSEIELAYKILRRDAVEEDTPLANKRLELLDEAITLLLDPERKTEYDLNYEDNLVKDKSEKPTRQFTDFSKLRSSGKQSWMTLVDTSKPIGTMLSDLIELHALLPNSEIQKQILSAQLLAPTALCNCLPIIFYSGVSGSGKTQLIQLTRNTWGTIDTLNAESSGKSIRNEVDENKYYIPGYSNTEKVIHGVVFDDASSRTFNANPYLFGLLKGGYSRGSDVMSIALKEGGNVKFYVFGSRAFSSIAPIATMPQFTELARRMLVIHTAKAATANVIVPEAFEWGGLNQKVVDFWEDRPNAIEFSRLLGNLTNAVANGKLKSNSSSTELTVSLSMLASGIATGIWKNEVEAIDCLDEYWEYCRKKNESKKSATLSQIHKFLAEKQARSEADGVPVLFTNKELIRRLGHLERDNYLDDRLTPSQVAAIVKDCGYLLIDGFWRLE